MFSVVFQMVEIYFMIFAGDTYITKLENEFYGVFRVLQVGVRLDFLTDTDCYLILITSYADTKKPTLDDSRILQPL